MLELLPPPAITWTFILALRSMPNSSQSLENTRSTLKCREANAPVGITTSISRGDSPASRMAPRAASTAASISLRSGKRPDGTSPMPTTAADADRLDFANCLLPHRPRQFEGRGQMLLTLSRQRPFRRERALQVSPVELASPILFRRDAGRHRGTRAVPAMWNPILIWIYYVRLHMLEISRKGLTNEKEAIGIEAESRAA